LILVRSGRVTVYSVITTYALPDTPVAVLARITPQIVA
jgi:hypothetical protein